MSLSFKLGIPEPAISDFMTQEKPFMLIVYPIGKEPCYYFIASADYLSIKQRRGTHKQFTLLTKAECV